MLCRGNPYQPAGNISGYLSMMAPATSTLLAVAEAPLVTNDAVVFGMLMVILGVVFYTSSLKTQFWRKFYTFVPPLLLCYFLPSLLSSAGIISGEKYLVDGVERESQLYFVSSRYLLPASLVLLTLSVDLKAILRLGPKALVMFLTGTAGIVVGGPLSILLFAWTTQAAWR